MSAGLTTLAGLRQRVALWGAGGDVTTCCGNRDFTNIIKGKTKYLQYELLRSKQQLTYSLGLVWPLFLLLDRTPYLVIYCINDMRQNYSKRAKHIHYCDNCHRFL